MATKQSRLEKISIESRIGAYAQSTYSKTQGNEYSAEHQDAKWHENDENKPYGKGTGVSMGKAKLPGESGTKAIDYSVVDTHEGGGSYDIYGRNGIGGRKRSKANQLYVEDSYEYGRDIIDTSINENEHGQFFVKPYVNPNKR